MAPHSKTNIEAPRKAHIREHEAKVEAKVEAKIEEARPQLKSSRRTAQLGLLQATPVATPVGPSA